MSDYNIIYKYVYMYNIRAYSRMRYRDTGTLKIITRLESKRAEFIFIAYTS